MSMRQRRRISGHINQGYHRIWLIAVSTFVVTFFVSGATRGFLEAVSPFVSVVLLLIVILIGILFDIIGTAVVSAHESPFHAMAAKRVFGASHAVRLVRRAGEVANFCNDLVGDVAGTLSGAMGAMLVASLQKPLLIVIMAPIVSTLTVAGKALGKGPAIKHANMIVYRVARILAWWESGLSRGRKRLGRS
jgi:CBS domain containing-hemolysin-like protein